jgi:hypothetical protein
MQSRAMFFFTVVRRGERDFVDTLIHGSIASLYAAGEVGSSHAVA